jgi:hypothetical protein
MSEKIQNKLAGFWSLLTVGDDFEKTDSSNSDCKRNEDKAFHLGFRNRKAARLAELRAHRESHKAK